MRLRLQNLLYEINIEYHSQRKGNRPNGVEVFGMVKGEYPLYKAEVGEWINNHKKQEQEVDEINSFSCIGEKNQRDNTDYDNNPY